MNSSPVTLGLVSGTRLMPLMVMKPGMDVCIAFPAAGTSLVALGEYVQATFAHAADGLIITLLGELA